MRIPSTTRLSPLGIALIYASLAAFWILFSDLLVEAIFKDPAQLAMASVLKGWAFVVVTTLLLFTLMKRQSTAGGDKNFALPRWYRLPIVLLLGGIAVSTGVGINFSIDQQRDKEVARIQAVADLKRQQISDWLNERQGDLSFLQSSTYTAEQYRRWREQGDTAGQKAIVKRLQEISRYGGFSGASMFDAGGVRLLVTGKAPEQVASELRAALGQARQDGRAHRVGPYRDAEGKIRLDFVTALLVAGDKSPLIVLHALPADWLFPTLTSWPVPTDSGESLLFRRDGDAVLFLNDLRYRPGSGGTLRLPIRQSPTLSARILRGEHSEGVFVSGNDYRGVAVLGVTRQIPGTDWYLQSKVDWNEIYRDSFRQFLWIGLSGIMAVLMVLTAAYLLQQRERLAMARGTQQAQAERLQALQLLAAIADSSEDAIFAKDREGRYLMFNRAAARFAGRDADAIIGQDDFALFPFEQASMLHAIDSEVVASDSTRSGEGFFPTPEGKRFFQFMTGPLHGEQGEIIGVFGISRDMTERRQAEMALRESEGHFRALVEQSLAGIYIITDRRFRYVNPRFAAIFGYDSPQDVIERVQVDQLVHPADRERVMRRIAERLGQRQSDAHYSFSGLRRDGSVIVVEVHGCASEYKGEPAIVGLILDTTARQAAEQALRQQSAELSLRNVELERMNRAMVGRELDMIELKREVNALSSRLGLPPPYGLGFLPESTIPSSGGDKAESSTGANGDAA